MKGALQPRGRGNGEPEKGESSETKARFLKALAKPNTRYKFHELKRITKLSNGELEKLIAECRKEGHQIVYGKFDKTWWLSTIPTPYSDIYDLSHLPKEGILGLISDTHLCNRAERLDLLEKAYDTFVKEGALVVFHAGDMTDGWEVYRGHQQFVKVIGVHHQAAYCMKYYPRRQGLKTFVIAGNHDATSFLKVGVDQLSLVVSGFWLDNKFIKPREDIVYLGQYSRYIKLPQEVTIQMLHVRGGLTYAKSYPQQKRAWAFDRNTQPDIQLTGHLHQFSYIYEDGCRMVALSGMQDETEFFKRAGWPRELGICLAEYRIEDTHLTRFKVDPIFYK